MALHVKKSTGWAKASGFYVKKPTGWAAVTKAYVKKVSGWVLFWPKEGPQPEERIEISSDSTEYPATLTGKNYHWESGNIFSYKFQHSKTDNEDDVHWTDIGTYQTISNPTTGSFNIKTHELAEEDFELEQNSTWFRFVVKGEDTTALSEGVDVSLPLEITVPDAAMYYSSHAVTDTTIAVSYTENDFLSYYIKEIYGPSGLVESTTVDPAVSPVSFTGLTPNTSYDIVVYPYNFVEVSGTALIAAGISTPNTKPENTTPPTVSPSSGTEGVTQFSVTSNGTWTASPTSYNYKWKYLDQGSTWIAAPAPNDLSTYTTPSGYISTYGTSLKCDVTANNGTLSDPASSNTVTILPATRTVSWNANGGSVTPSSSTGNAPNYTVTTPTPTRSSYSFNGWYNTQTGDYTYGPISGNTSWDIPAGVTTMYARWTFIPAPTNTVAPSVTPSTGTAGVTSYSTTNGTWTGSPTSYSYQWQYRDSGSIYVSISGATSSSYTPPSDYVSTYGTVLRCVVTATNGGGSTSANSNDVSVSSPTRTVYWSVANGGTVTPTSSTVTTPFSVTNPTPTRDNYDFIGWYDTQTGSYTYGGPTNGAAGVSFTVPYDGITMYARWTAKTVGSASLSITNVTTSGFTASWSATNAVTYFVDIFRTSNAVSIPDYPKTNTTLTTSGAITGLLSGTQYTVQVYGKNIEGTAGTQAVSNVTTATVSTTTTTPAPTTTTTTTTTTTSTASTTTTTTTTPPPGNFCGYDCFGEPSASSCSFPCPV